MMYLITAVLGLVPLVLAAFMVRGMSKQMPARHVPAGKLETAPSLMVLHAAGEFEELAQAA